jgi:hypothetical protein
MTKTRCILLAVAVALLAGWTGGAGTGNADAAEAKARAEDQTILGRVLRQVSSQHRALLVAPMTDPSFLIHEDRDSQMKARQYVLKSFRDQGHDVAALYDELLRKNRKPVKLALKPAENDGYSIAKNGEGYGLTRVSLPAYERKTGRVLVYAGSVEGPLAGSGALYLYKYDGKKLVLLHQVILWIS